MATGITSGVAPASIFDRKPFPDLVDPLFQRIEPGMQGTVVQVKNISQGGKSEDPVMGLDVIQDCLDRVPDEGERAQQNVHRVLP
jgi:hypothetical protein